MATRVHDERLELPGSAYRAPALLVRRWRGVLFAALLVVAAIAVGLVIKSTHDAERNAIARMDPSQRRILFDESRRSTEALCMQARTNAALADRCIDAAQFLLLFPECDTSCVAFARAHQQEATR